MGAPSEEREIGTLVQAIQLLDEWIEAYEELRRANVQLLHRHIKLERELLHAHSALDHFEFLVTWEPGKMRPESECDF